jgi:hypothetical protein
MPKRIAIFGLVCLLNAGALAQTVLPSDEQSRPRARDRAIEVLTEAAIIAAIIAASVSAYKAKGKPCACPEDRMRNGRKCRGVSAWARHGGYAPLCYATDVTPAMIAAYRLDKTVPGLK